MDSMGKDRSGGLNKKRTFEILQPGGAGDPQSRAFDFIIIGLILANVVTAILLSVDSVADSRYGTYLFVFELLSLLVFTEEYLVRLWACTVDERYSRPVWGRIRFAFTPLALIDLIAISPLYLLLIFPGLGASAEALLMLRLLRLFKMFRYSRSVKVFAGVVKSRREELVAAFSFTIFLLIFSSILMFFVEHQAQPEAFPNIPAALWWAVITLTTVGYGDVSPITPLGKMLGAVTALLGIGLVVLPSGILASGFVQEYSRMHDEEDLCQHCGKPRNKPPHEVGEDPGESSE
ncbi:MAG: ion transporter [Rubrobacteraceae bacterium]